MINTIDFAKRLQIIMDLYDESASSFAEKIGVQRSSISHILSGRNRPSLDFVLKVLSSYPDVELYWLLNGKGKAPDEYDPTVKNTALTPRTEIENKTSTNVLAGKTSSKEIERIVIFYTDGSFENFEK